MNTLYSNIVISFRKTSLATSQASCERQFYEFSDKHNMADYGQDKCKINRIKTRLG